MTSSTTTKPADGGPATGTEVKPERVRGRARLREDECYHLTGLVLSALHEAEHLVEVVHGKATHRYTDFEGSSEPLEAAEVTAQLADAYHCACAAVTYIDKAADRWAEETFDPPY